ncbi:MAG: cytochrome b/b6 domain-containing protein [Acidobacteria bacterium]|nr:cytochrome b/b6 domain-containing protein [Acidobacteriota bacterium]
MNEEKPSMPRAPSSRLRFSVPQRLEHLVLMLSFTILGVTGLVQKYARKPLSEWLIEMTGGIQSTRILHRAAAVVFSLLAVYHIIAVAYKLYVRRDAAAMLPGTNDFRDAFHSVKYSLFLSRKAPRMPRYNFAEKIEYWSLVWGGIIIVITGFMLWNPLMTTAFLPGQVIPAARTVHGAEAVLAVLAILVWHVYHVHVKIFNKSMFNGKMTGHQMEEEHGAEWSDITSSKEAHPGPADPARRRRQAVFLPAAALFAALSVGAIYWGATAEATAIETLPEPASRPETYSPKMPDPPLPAGPESVSAPLIPHAVEGREKCDTCHGPSKMSPMPANHRGRPLESCGICHKPSPAKKTSGTGPGEAKAGGPQPVPHPVDAAPYTNCLNCHGTGKVKAFSENHSGYPVESCTACHK